MDTFLKEHGGPGIQHVGLYTNDMVDTIASLQKTGVEFVEPPYTYYTEVCFVVFSPYRNTPCV